MSAEGETRGPLGLPAFWTRLLSRQVQFALDASVLVGAFALAYLVRFDFEIPTGQLHQGLVQLPYVVLCQFAALFVAGVYAFVWRYIGLAEIKAFVQAAWWSALPVLALRLALPERFQQWRVPLSIILVDTLLAFAGVLALRVLRRMIYERYERRRRVNGSEELKPVLLVGAGRAGVLAAKEIQGRGDLEVRIVGFVDDDEAKAGAVIQGVKVLGSSRDLPRLCRKHAVDHVIITIAQASRGAIRRIVEICEQIPVKARIIPGLYEILDGRVEVSRIRDVEIADLLGREPVELDEASLADFIAGKVVMVTGAGGSIGAELARQAARFSPSRLLLVERAEFVLFDVDRELRGLWPELEIVPVVADVGDEARMRAVVAEHEPRVVLHAAAHKHVPMMESNPGEAIKNNVVATRMLGEIAGEGGVEAFVFISTDKAVNPSSVMGASKRLAELVVQDLDTRYPTRYMVVRFGNVIGSAGSVVPIFREQIAAGGPVTVTHPDMVRYFMTIPEAAQLVLQAGAMGLGGEIFILDMGEPVLILGMARDMITLMGFKPYEEIDIVFSGIRPGEKLFEELDTSNEKVSRTVHPKILIGRVAGLAPDELGPALERLAALSADGDDRRLRLALNEILPEARLQV